ncbi:hypothetical protein FB45DRAFT_900156 [Roridomyces roridus]|uniref:Fungal-type protein kinase domain-containing protein n=1 Tax=Roridomyces roridus TaxID=1738132 RepID=A0AAD7C9H5_9AGAR|nr:hypothetical protein FB45DRAFT_900156 [Roridomyces roridus]
MVLKNFAETYPVSEFLRVMGTDDIGDKISAMVDAASTLQAEGQKLRDAKKESGMQKPLVEYLQLVAEHLPEGTRFIDTSHTVIRSLDGGHYTKPDVTGTKPGTIKKEAKDLRWPDAGTVFELKYKVDIFAPDPDSDKEGDEKVNGSIESLKALVQVAKNARSLLMASGSAHVYVVTVFKLSLARIFRFDRSSFCATRPFDLIDEPSILPTFLWRLYNPQNSNTLTRMFGADDTISVPDDEDKKKMIAAVHKHPFYRDHADLTSTEESLWILAVRSVKRGDGDSGTCEVEVVRCFTFGGVLSISDGLFSRATRVYRVVLEQDAEEEYPTIYALKDAWPQRFRRPEVDFYDFIAKHCEELVNSFETEGGDVIDPKPFLDSFAKCHGSVFLSEEHRQLLPCDDSLHQTQPPIKGANVDTDEARETLKHVARRHVRLLLTPVGAQLKKFETTKSLVEVIHNAMDQHRIVYNAGIIHRDISEGNVLFREVLSPQLEFDGFLVDWDYAEFTEEGVKQFNEWFPGRKEAARVDKSLKDMTGTFPFMAIELVRRLASRTLRGPAFDEADMAMISTGQSFAHGAHHDVESFYWLLIWIVLRHTDFLVKDELTCKNLFELVDDAHKHTWVHKNTLGRRTANPGLFNVLELFRSKVALQYPAAATTAAPVPVIRRRIGKAPPPAQSSAQVAVPPAPAVLLDHETILDDIEGSLQGFEWPTDDKAVELRLQDVAVVDVDRWEQERSWFTNSLTGNGSGATIGSKRGSTALDLDGNDEGKPLKRRATGTEEESRRATTRSNRSKTKN